MEELMKPVHFIIVFVMIVAVVTAAFVIAMPGVEKENVKSSATDADRLKNRVNDLEQKVAELEGKLQLMESLRMSTTTTIQDLGTKVREIEKKIGPDATAMNTADNGDVTEAAALAANGGMPVSKAAESEFLAKVKEEIKKDLKEAERAKKLEQKEKKAEGTRRWMTEGHKKKMEGFGEFAQKIELRASQEEDIRRIADESFEKIMTILDEAFAQPEDEVDWGPVKQEIGEIHEDAATQIEQMVTEEQAKHIGEYFESGK
jgi:hypothetical protein